MKPILVVIGPVISLVFLVAAGLGQEPASAQNQSAPPPATVTGSGTANYIPLWTGSSTLGNSKLFQTGGKIGVNTNGPTVQLDVNGRVNVSKNYSINGLVVLANPVNNENVAVGASTLVNTTGVGNTATGSFALQFNTTGGSNTATGENALSANTVGNYNTAAGYSSLLKSQAADGNTALGSFALEANTSGAYNVAEGFEAQTANQSGSYNTSVGPYALQSNTTGSENIAIGHLAAASVSGGNSNNIHIGNTGISSDNGVIRIGTTQAAFFVAGVSGVTTGVNDAVPVVVDANGQFGTISSSRRFKEDIQDMASVSQGLMRLRPVTFRYQKAFADGSKPVQYGLIAEEVAEVYPDLVTHSADGQVETVKYQVLDSMLLNEMQKQQGTIQQQQAEIDGLKEKLEKVEAALASISGAR
jgi:hypothetical protein